jgi:uncharacterized protein (TIGR01777 family)
MKIVIPGGTGQVGRVLAPHFHGAGHHVTVIARHLQPAPWRTVTWNGRDDGPWMQEVDGADVVINLAGRSVNCRYTEANRRQILISRVESTRAVGRAIAQANRPPAIWMNASTATIYRNALDRPMDEATGEIGDAGTDYPSAWRFSVEVVKAWEQALFDAPTPKTRRIAMRTAIMMAPRRGGVFSILSNLSRLGLGGPAGPGTQFVSWIHDADLVRAIEFLIGRAELEGCVNISSPNPLVNRDFMRAIREAYEIPFGLPAASWMLEIAAFFHRTETELLLKSRRVLPTRLINAGFEFAFPEWPEAARDLVRRRRDARLPHA